MNEMLRLYDKIYHRIGRAIYYRYPKLRDWMPDKMYLQQYYALRMGYYMDFNNPQTFNEKLQWLKLYDRKAIYTTMADKIEAKKWVVDKIGEQHIIPTLAVYDTFDEIDFDKLPQQFVMKCSHDSGSVVICKDKSTFDYPNARKVIETGLNRSWFLLGREWAYKNVKPRIIIEQFMCDRSSKELTDYKFYCFNGVPKFLYVSYGLSDHSIACINYMTLDGQKAPFQRPDFEEYEKTPPPPLKFDVMLKYSKVLSEGVPFLRTDFYEINNEVYFSELTFYPGCGMTPFEPRKWDIEIGKWITLPKR